MYYSQRLNEFFSVPSMHRFFKILLAIIVVSCPIRCQLGWSDCCGDSNSSVPAECCCGDTGLEMPAFPEEDTEERCGCICSGATMPNAADLFYQTSVPFEFELVPFLTVSFLSVTNDLGYCLCSSNVFEPVCARNHGRNLRCLHGSFII